LQNGATCQQNNVGPGCGNWTDVSGTQIFNYLSPRFGVTYTLSPRQVLRASAGRYVQQPETFGTEYKAAPWFGVQQTASILNRFYDPLNFTAVHDLRPQDSTNYDLSFEQDFSSGLSAKITPYARVSLTTIPPGSLGARSPLVTSTSHPRRAKPRATWRVAAR